MLRIASVLVVLVAIFGACSGDDGGSSAGDPASREQELRATVDDAFAAFTDGDSDEFYSYFSDSFQDRCDIDDFSAVMAIARVFISEVDGGELTIEGVSFGDDGRATVNAQYEAEDEDSSLTIGEDEGFLDYWVIEDGEWKTDTDDPKPCDLSADSGGEEGEATVATGPGTSRDEAMPIGEPVRIGDFEATVLDVNLDAADEIVALDDFNDPPAAGNRYVLVTVRAHHAGEGSDTISVSTSDFKLTGSNNVVYDGFSDSSCGFLDGEIRGEMFAGGTLEGIVCFQVPEEETGFILVAQPFFSFEDSDRRYLALE